MPRGLIELKKRHSRANEQRAQLRAAAVAFNKNRIEINQILRLDFQTGIETPVSTSGFRFGLIFETGFEINRKLAPYSSIEQVAREQMESGARLFTDKAEYRIEKQKIQTAGRIFAAANAA